MTWLNETLIATFFVAGISVGFGHCIGMCGPIAVSLTLGLKGKSIWMPHLLYSFGRTLTYAAMGAVVGVTGAFAQFAGSLAFIQKTVMIGAGILIILMGLAMGNWLPLGRFFSENVAVGGWVSKGFHRLSSTKSTLAYLPIGLFLGLLPCGPVYTALVGSARAGMDAPTPLLGGVVGFLMMLSFGLGTIPAMFLVAKLADLGWVKSRQRLLQVGAALMIAVGAYFLYQALDF